MRLYSQALFKLTISQDFDAVFPFLYDPNALQELGRYYGAILESVQLIEVHNSIFFPEYIGKTALWQPPLERHLTALKPGARLPAGAR